MVRPKMDWMGAGVFVALAFGLSWGWLFAVPHLNIPLWTIGFGMFAPAIAALLVRGPLLREGFRQSGLGFATPPGRAWTYVFALAVPPIIVVIAAVVMVLTGSAQYVPGQSHDPFQGQDFFWALAAAHGPSGLLSYFAISPLLSFVAFGEEYGWRGYLFPKLMPLGLPAAVLGSGFIWAIWHAPGYFIYENNGLGAFARFVVSTTVGSTVLCWLRLRGRSVWPAAIYHEAFDDQGPALAGLLTPTGMPAPQLTAALPAFLLIFEFLMFGYLFISERIQRAAREDYVVWTGLTRRQANS